MELSVGDAMTRGVIYVPPEESISGVAQIMKKNDIDSVIVIDKGKGVGMVTDTDIIVNVVAEGKNPKTVSVTDVMTSPLLTIAPEKDIDDATNMMRENGVKRLVVTQSNNIIGIITVFDLIAVEPAVHTLIKEHAEWDIADISSPAGTISGICEVCGNYSENLTNLNGRLLGEDCMKEE